MKSHLNFDFKNSRHLLITGGCALGLLISGGVIASFLSNNQDARTLERETPQPADEIPVEVQSSNDSNSGMSWLESQTLLSQNGVELQADIAGSEKNYGTEFYFNIPISGTSEVALLPLTEAQAGNYCSGFQKVTLSSERFGKAAVLVSVTGFDGSLNPNAFSVRPIEPYDLGRNQYSMWRFTHEVDQVVFLGVQLGSEAFIVPDNDWARNWGCQ